MEQEEEEKGLLSPFHLLFPQLTPVHVSFLPFPSLPHFSQYSRFVLQVFLTSVCVPYVPLSLSLLLIFSCEEVKR